MVVIIEEKEVKGTVFKISGGGTLYNTIDSYADCLYKHVADESEMAMLLSLADAWQSLDGSDWVVPRAYVCDD